MALRLKVLPTPISGLMLALFSLGNLLNPIHPMLRYFFGFIALIILIALVAKLLLYPKMIKEDFSNPVLASVMATFPMSLIVLSTYIVSFTYTIGFILWALGIFLNILLVILFTIKHVFPWDIKKVFPSYFVLYVGVVVGSVAAPLYDMQSVGQVLFWYGLIIYGLLIIIVSYRVLFIKNLLEPIKPTLIIYTAPASLLLIGYLSSFAQVNSYILYPLAVWAGLMVLVGLINLPKLLQTSFYPSWSSFTFPFVISAIALQGFNNRLEVNQVSLLSILQILLILWALCIVLFVLVQYVIFLKNPVLKRN